MKFVVIGGNPAGMSAASRVKRRQPDSEVVVLEKTREVSYGACGLPYYVAGLNNDLNLMRIRKASEFEATGICVKLGCTAERVDFAAKIVFSKDENGNELAETYDKLLIASGSSPRVPNISGVDKGNIFTLKTLQDAERLRAAIDSNPGTVVIVGGGAIGLEIAEACILRGVRNIELIEAVDQLASPFDMEFSEEVQKELELKGVNVHLKEKVVEIEGAENVECVVTDKGRYQADVVVLSVGVVPNTQFAEGIEKLPNGAIVTDRAMRTSIPDVFAAGDCASVWHMILQKPVYLALGTNANKQGRFAGDSVLGKEACFDHALGTVMVRCMDMELAKTGLSEREAAAAGIKIKTNTVQARSHARYYPDPCMITIKLCYREEDHVIVGAQLMGKKETALRVNALAVAIDRKMTTEELGVVDFGYAPPFASVWDAVHIAANASK